VLWPWIGTDQHGSNQIREYPRNPWLAFLGFRKRSSAVQFQIKGQDYFLAFVEQEKRWYVFSPTPQGVHRIPVYVDAATYDRAGSLDINTSLSS
jgi:hypothetical protein